MPFNSSTPVFYVNKDAFKKAGLDPEKAPKTWKEFEAAAAKLKAAGQDCVYTTSWPSWVHVENFSAWHNLPIGTKQNGFGGLDTRFTINSPTHVKHVAMLGDFVKKGYFTYAGLGNKGDAKFASGDCAMFTGSSGARANIKKLDKFAFSVNFLPYHDDVKGAPQNSIIGGATLWVLSQKDPKVYPGIAKFFTYLSSVEVQAKWHQQTGYVPITNAAYDATKAAGFYDREPGHRRPGAPAELQGAHGQLEGAALRQLRAGPQGDRGGDGGGVRRQEGRQDRDERRGEARQRDPRAVPGGE